MSFKIDKKKDCTVLKVNTDKLDGLVSSGLKAELVSINAEGEKNIIIDLSETRYCDSSGLSAILIGNRLCKGAGGRLILVGLIGTVKKLISISQLDKILTIVPTMNEGLKAINKN